jgi:hypothetical protein
MLDNIRFKRRENQYYNPSGGCQKAKAYDGCKLSLYFLLTASTVITVSIRVVDWMIQTQDFRWVDIQQPSEFGARDCYGVVTALAMRKSAGIVPSVAPPTIE